MHRSAMILASVALMTATACAESDSKDSSVTQTLLTEIRQLRQDLQRTAATIQRVQIAVYRVQSQTEPLDRANSRLESVRTRCSELQDQLKLTVSEVEQVAGPQREALKADAARLTDEEQQCRTEQAEAETQVRAEQLKMDDYQEQLNRLDAVLAAYGGK
jgi:chromosome segregation ATPase